MLTNDLKNQFIVPLTLEEYLDREETGDAELFAQLFTDKVVFDHSTKDWYIWQGQYWGVDKTREVTRFVSNDLVAEYNKAAYEVLKARSNSKLSSEFIKRAKNLNTKKRIDNILHLATSIKGIGLSGEEWNKDPDILPVNNGVIDLNTGKIRDALPSEYIRFHAPIDWQGLDYACPIWNKSISEYFNSDNELIAYIQRLFGYSLTGHVSEHILPILWGEGRNGKTTILEMISEVLGQDFCFTTPSDTFMNTTKSGDAPQPFLFGFRGKRLVWATESREGQSINLSLVKQLTGGDTITARPLYGKPVSFQPSHKIMLLTNHRPSISSTDQAIWDRVILIEFPIRFVDNPLQKHERKKDPELTIKLKQEAPGILAWLVKGCLEWKLQGLNPPECVKNATKIYREDEDVLGNFLIDCCDEVNGSEEKSSDLYVIYKKWCDENYNPVVSHKIFGQSLVHRLGGCIKKNNGNYYPGIRIKSHLKVGGAS